MGGTVPQGGAGLNDALRERLEQIARAPVLLVGSDYDGTLAPIVDDPSMARPLRESMVALRALAQMPQTCVAVISGRALRDLASLTGAPEEVHLVGSHGSEFDPGFAASLNPATRELLDRVRAELDEIASAGQGLSVEHKPASIALHYRNASEQVGDDARRRALEGPARFEGVHTKEGKKVVELSVLATSKGEALQTIRHRVGASAALFIGDDVTDEDAFATLHGPDLGIKVGPGDTRAGFRIDDTTEVARVLAALCELRQAWLAGRQATPIDEHAMLSDQRTVALLTRDARVVWMCSPRIDSPAVFAELVGGASAGHFSIEPLGNGPAIGQSYDEDSMVLTTRWATLSVTDYLDCSGGRPIQRAGRADLVRVVQGTGRVRVCFAPRLDFGRTPTRLVEREGGLEVEGAIEPMVLRCPGVSWTMREEGPHHTAEGEADLSSGPLVLELRCGTGSLEPSVTPEVERRKQTRRFWSRWADTLVLPDQHADMLRRSALLIRALQHGPTGAIAAAGTTSLPESLGGVRNWDYRYCWPRDAAMAGQALARLGSPQEGLRFLDWMLGIVDQCETADRIAPVYTVTGGHLMPEAEIGELAGYAGSRPVRIGNAASRQVQLDVFGPVAELIAELVRCGAPLSSQHWCLADTMAEAVRHRWQEPDHGIWEIRLSRQHHVHTKVMCWMTLDRAATISERFLGRARPDLRELRDRVRDEVLERGYSERAGMFSATYDNGGVDAAVLWTGLSGMVAPDDERFIRTVEAVERELREGPVVYRYRYEDGLPGVEGGFHICTAWLIEAYALIGRLDEARSLFSSLVSLIGPTGLLSEQHDLGPGRALGNTPQAYSHLGLINAALALREVGA